MEFERLEAAGHLDRVLDLLEGAEAQLLVSSCRPAEGLEELVGALRPRGEGTAEAPALRSLPPDNDDEDPIGCGPEGEAPAIAVGQRSGWDHEGVLAARSRFTVVLPTGEAREVYMPDHVCPACFNDAGNAIDACSRVCGACRFAW